MSGRQLSDRRQQVLKLFKEGVEPKEIAVKLAMTRNAVYQHIGYLRQNGFLPERPGVTPRLKGLDSVDQLIETVRMQAEALQRTLQEREAQLQAELADVREELQGLNEVLGRARGAAEE